MKGNASKAKPYVHIIGDQPNICSNPDDKFFAGIEPFTPTSIEFLNQIIADTEPFRMLTFDSFVPLEETSAKSDSYGQKFEKSIVISKTELKAQIYYDLCAYNIFIKKYDVGKEMILLCRDNLKKLNEEFAGKLSEIRFCTVSEENLKGYLLACGIFEQEPASLFQRFNESVLNKNKDLESILNEDNYKCEIPFIHRKILEMDNEQSSTENIKVTALNSIRFAVENNNNILASDTTTLKFKNNAHRNIFLKFFIQVRSFAISDDDDATFRNFFYSIFILSQYSNEIHSKLPEESKAKIVKYLVTFPANDGEFKESKYFTKSKIESLKQQRVADKAVKLSNVAVQSDWIIPDGQHPAIKFGDMERKLVMCTATKQLRKLLVDLARSNPQQPLWSINKNWFIPSEIRIAILNLKRGFLQDFSYILLGKVHEMVQKKDFATALNLLADLRTESKRPEWANDANVNKLGKLIDFEKANIQIISRLDSYWPKKPPTIKDPWSVKLKQVLVNSDLPRLEIIENCLIMFLNLNDWNSCLTANNKLSPPIELCSTFATMMNDMQLEAKNKNPPPRKREFWDLVLPIFSISSQQQQNPNPKRNQNNRRSSDSPARLAATSMNISVFRQFLERLRDPFVITIMLSMLAKMHNLLKDDSNMELNIENVHLWPLSIPNVNGYNIKSLTESLNQLLKLGLKLYPMNIPWIKLQGDLEFVNGNNENAMKYYVQSIVIATEYCSLPIQKPLTDENIIKKMIKCSFNLGCFLQSAVLCQFMEEVDYTLAFKCLQEKAGNFQDAMDAYYSLIWDSTLLEYIINLHYKKGEHKRRLQAISFIRMLELNSNNNDDIKYKAAAIRKIKFIRSLANQYM